MTVQDLRNQLKEIGLEGLEKVCVVFREKKKHFDFDSHTNHILMQFLSWKTVASPSGLHKSTDGNENRTELAKHLETTFGISGRMCRITCALPISRTMRSAARRLWVNFLCSFQLHNFLPYFSSEYKSCSVFQYENFLFFYIYVGLPARRHRRI